MYVWFDALTNYISTLGWPEDAEGNFKKFWTRAKRCSSRARTRCGSNPSCGRRCSCRPALKTTDKVFYHGFITSGGQKMSQIDRQRHRPDRDQSTNTAPTRCAISSRGTSHPFEDSDFTMERFKEAYNADLANGLGNLVARIMTLAETYLTRAIGGQSSCRVYPDISVAKALNAFDIQCSTSVLVAAYIVCTRSEMISEQRTFQGRKNRTPNG